MTNAELYGIPVLGVSNAKVGVYSKGELYITQYGKVYVFTHSSGQKFRIARKAISFLSVNGQQYKDMTDYADEEPGYRILKEFEILLIDGGVIHLVDDIYSNRLPF